MLRLLATLLFLAMDASDVVEFWMDEQARMNSAVDDGDVNNLVGDTATISGEVIGLVGTLTTSTTAPPHFWSDGQSPWGFVSWA